jgi:hypothetical protein
LARIPIAGRSAWETDSRPAQTRETCGGNLPRRRHLGFSMPTSARTMRIRLALVAAAAILLAVGCASSGNELSLPPATLDVELETLLPSPAPSPTASPSVVASAYGTCPGQTWPPYGSVGSVPGISVNVIDQGHLQLISSAARTYYYVVSRWTTDLLTCGIGTTEQEGMYGPIRPGETVDFAKGSTQDVPLTIKISERKCGEGGCPRPPIGLYLVPVSSVPASPIRTD